MLYNGVLPAISLDGRRYFYVNPLRKVRDLPFPLRWSRTRERYIGCFCCPPNIVRTIAEVSNYVYGLSPNTLWVHLYGAGRLDTTLAGARIGVVQETAYPWEGSVRLTVKEAPVTPLTVKLRIPGWARTAAVAVNGKPAEGQPEPGSYFSVTRSWKAGDVIELELPMPVTLLEAHPLVEESRNQVAVQRGPIVYCLESNDLPAGVRMENVVLPLESRLAPRRMEIGGADLRALSGQALDLARPPWKPGQLYRKIDQAAPRRIDATLIPYYAWGNRGDTEMMVWLPARGTSRPQRHAKP
jgi:DUF1680 family protein